MKKMTMFLLGSLLLILPVFGQDDAASLTPPPNLGWPGSQTFSLFHRGTASYRVDFGVQPVDADTDSSKFEEYRDLPDGFVLPFFAVASAAGAESRWLVTGEDVGEQDMRFTAGVELGEWSFDVFYDEIFHRLGNDARSLLEQTRPDYYAMSDTLQAAFQSAIEARRAGSPASVNFAFLRDLVSPSLQVANTFDMDVLRHRGFFQVNYGGGWWGATPGTTGGGPESVGPGRSGITFTYFQENRTGLRPSGTSFGFGNVVETAQPLDHVTRDLGFSAEMPMGNASLRGSLHINLFRNGILAHQFDNPFRAVDSTDPNAYQAPGSGSINGPTRGLVALPPDNQALTGALSFLWRLPMQSRFTADVQMGQWTQDEQLFPFTTNTAIVFANGQNASGFNALPVDKFDGEINTFTGALSFSSRPMERLNVSAKLRSYDLQNDSPRVRFEQGYVRFDAALNATPRITVPYGNKATTGDVAVSYDFGFFDLEGGFRTDTRERTFREVEETTENTIRLATTFRPISWAAVRASLESGTRDFDGPYHADEAEHASFLNPGAATNQPGLRRFDLSARDVTRASALVQLTPFGNVGLTMQYVGEEQDYDDEADLGLLNVDNQALTFEVDYSPEARWSVYGFLTLESYNQFQRGRQSGATPSTNPADDWTADVEDDVNTLGFGGTYALAADLDLKLFARMQEVNGFNDLESPPGGTPDVAFDIPQFDDTDLWNASAELEYRLTDVWRASLGAWFEDYKIRDAQTSGTTNYMPGGFFLAPNDSDYAGTVAYLRLSYRR